MPAVAPSTDTAWAELHTNIRGFVARRVRQPADVDDIVQQVFLRVHQALPTLRDADKLHAWIYQTTRRTIVDHYRAPSQRREVPAGTAVDVFPDDQPGDVTADEGEESALQELAACLTPLIGKLARADREALRLIEFEGVTQVEAAGRLGLSVSGMKSRVQRARLHLRSALDDCCRIALDRRGGVLGYEGRGDQCGSCGCGSISNPADSSIDPV
jgi:RNA polymerase sigma-70 factor (ECF subfamily)